MDLFIGMFIISLLLLVYYFNTKKYNSIEGVFILLMGLVLILLKLLLIGSLSLIVRPETFLIAGLYVSIITVLGIIVVLLFKRVRKGLKYNLKYLVFLLFLYIFFGYLQQLLFQFIFTETVFFITEKIWLSVIISAFYYFIFHLRSKRIEFLIGTFLLGLMWTTSYLVFGNIFWLGLSHGIIGTVYYLNMWHMDVLRKRIGFIDKFL